MSDIFFSALNATHQMFMTNLFDEELSELLTGEKIPKVDWSIDRTGTRRLSIGSRNNWFQLRLKELLDLSGINGLRFLSGETYTHRHKHLTIHEGEAVWQEIVGYTAINPFYDDVISSISSLEQWCLANPQMAAPILNINPEDLAGAFESAFFTLDPINEGFDSGESSEFMFSVLRTITDIMRFAKLNNYWAVYSTTLEYGYPSDA